MAYSDWQLNRLRDALRAYHDYGGRSLKEDFNWNSVAEGIAVELEGTIFQLPPNDCGSSWKATAARTAPCGNSDAETQVRWNWSSNLL